MINVNEFKINFPEFSNDTDEMIVAKSSQAKFYLSSFDSENSYMLQLMIAHLLYIRNIVDQGQHTLITKLANEGDVSISLLSPPSESNFYYWLNASPYGMQLLAYLEAKSVGGFYVGGSLETFTIRKLNGGF